jgi:DNA (cytosine-5)-methyltransferase 1
VNYYNEIDPFSAEWLRSLIANGEIPLGFVDERSIEDVRPDELAGYAQCHFFAGIGGWPLALRLAGWPDERSVWTGSCPCQPFSAAGKGAGFDDERHLWPALHWLIRQCRPAVLFGEQVERAIKHGWLDRVFSDLEGIGYSCGSAVLQASCADAPHKRDRLWFVAYSEWDEQPREESCGGPDGRVGGLQQPVQGERHFSMDWLSALSSLRVMDDGFPRCVAGTDAARNAIVPQAAAKFVMACMGAQA